MRYCIQILFLSFILLATSCAKKGSITGGAKDTIPPMIKFSNPKNFSTNFNGNEIRITFDEYVKLKDVNKQLIVSPPMQNSPIVTPTSASKYINIKFRDTLRENTTYSLNFGESIQDNNEGNKLGNYRFVFSTGASIDSLTVMGEIKDARNFNTDTHVNVMLFEYDENLKDSIIYKEKPLYITNTLENGNSFKIENVKAGNYYLIALKENNNNYLYNPFKDKIGFYPELITVPENSYYQLELFYESLPFKPLRLTQASGNTLYLGYEGELSNNIKISDIVSQKDLHWKKLSKSDTLQIWYPTPLKKDSINIAASFNGNEIRRFRIATTEQKKDSLKITGPSNVLHLRDTLTLQTSIPFTEIYTEKIKLFTSKDSSQVTYSIVEDRSKTQFQLVFDKKEDEKYHMSIYEGAIIDIYGHKNDSLNFKFGTKKETEYGNLRLHLSNVKSFPVIIELTDDKGAVLASYYTDSETTIDFNHLVPHNFTVRATYDVNQNGRWDPGNYLNKKQAEEVIYVPFKIDVRANWEVEQSINLGN